MIRKWQSENADPLLSLWLESTTEAHPFIAQTTGKRMKPWCGMFICRRETWVWEEDGNRADLSA
jgi:putative acetyltransferase